MAMAMASLTLGILAAAAGDGIATSLQPSELAALQAQRVRSEMVVATDSVVTRIGQNPEMVQELMSNKTTLSRFLQQVSDAGGDSDAALKALQAARDENLYEEKMRDILAAHNGANGLATSSAVMSAINYVPPAQVNIKGERHSGTHFLMAMMQHLYGEGSRIKPGVCPNSGGCPFCGNCATCDHTASVKEPSNTTYCCWRHGYADAQCAGFKSESYPLHLFVVRSPYPWLLAMHAQPYEYEGNYSVNRSVHRAARTVHCSHCTPCSQCAPHTEIAAPRVGAAATGPSPTSSAPSLPTSRSRTAATTRVARAR